MQTALNQVNPLIGLAADGFSALSQEFPTLAAAVSGSALAATALAASATAASVALTMVARNVPGAPAVPGMPTGGGTFGKALSFAGKATGIAAAFGIGYAGGTLLNDGINNGLSAFSGREQSLGGLIYELTHDDELKKNNSTTTSGGDMSWGSVQAPANQTININIDGRNVAEVVNSHNSEIFQRH